MDDGDITRLQLDVYMTREGPWNPEHGDVEIPEDWDFLPSGDAFVTRRVKAAETFWVAWRPRGRNRPHRRRLGLWAPKTVIVKVPASNATWSTWKRYCDVVGLSMGRAISALIDSELSSAVDERVEARSAVLAERGRQLDKRAHELDEREREIERQAQMFGRPR